MQILSQPMLTQYTKTPRVESQKAILWALTSNAAGNYMYGLIMLEDGKLLTVPVEELVLENANLSFEVLEQATVVAKELFRQ